MQMNRKRPRKTVLTTGKKSKKYYESRTSSQLETNEIDFSQFATFNVDFDDFMRPPVVNNKKESKKKTKTTQTGVPVCTQASQTSASIVSQCTQTETEDKPFTCGRKNSKGKINEKSPSGQHMGEICGKITEKKTE